MRSGFLSQLYCKKLTTGNVAAFVAARPDHIGWQINLQKFPDRAGLDQALADAREIADHLRDQRIVSVFLLHPCTDPDLLVYALGVVAPDIFLASAERSLDALTAVARLPGRPQIMVPIGIPSCAEGRAGYDPLKELEAYEGVADWYTTDTINDSDDPKRFGCSGSVSHWPTMAKVIARAARPVIAAGGLTAENVGRVLESCQPAGFDAHSAVCTGGLPDAAKAKAFVDAVRRLAVSEV